jgi:peptidoglycan hydrolase-like protein with peptidoglycan-binding domain
MLCMPFLAKARRGLGIAAALLLALAVLPPSASARAHGTAVAHHPAIVRAGDGYASPGGSGSVRWVQRRLHALGYHAGPTDGLFGPLTEAAVTRFQVEHHVRADGVVGPITAARLRAARPALRLGTGYLAPHGSKRVRAIQRRLRSLGYATGPVDGRFGPRTQGAVRAFQGHHRLVADGEVGPRTSTSLLAKATPRRPTPVTAPAPAEPPAFSGLPTGERPALSRATLPHAPPVEAILVALGVVGLAVVAGSYLRTRARIAHAARAQRAVPTVNGSTGEAR